MSNTQEVAQIRNKIMGALLADARVSSGRMVQECAEILGIPETDYVVFEAGGTTPTLPQLEVLAYFFNVPLDHFWVHRYSDRPHTAAEAMPDKISAPVIERRWRELRRLNILAAFRPHRWRPLLRSGRLVQDPRGIRRPRPSAPATPLEG